MRKIRTILIGGFFLCSFGLASFTYAQEDPLNNTPVYYKARVLQELEQTYESDDLIPESERYGQQVKVLLISGEEAGKELELNFYPGSQDEEVFLDVGDQVLVAKSVLNGEENYFITDRYRLRPIMYIALLFVALALALAGMKGLRSIVGLGFTILVLIFFIIPRILSGDNPLLVCFIGAVMIALVSLYIAHGFNRRTTIALVSTILCIIAALFASVFSVEWAQLFGFGSEEAFYLQVGKTAVVNARGLLLGGIIIGVLGVLDDITTAQTATIEQIYLANRSFSMRELARRGFAVGYEHIASLINTLALAYVGAAFPLLLLFTQSYQPWWILLNSETVAEEIIRTLVGSAVLILAVPLTTYLAAYYYSHLPKDAKLSSDSHTHQH